MSLFRSLRFKLWLAIALPLLILLGAQVGLNYLQLKQRFLDFSQESLYEQLPQLSERIVDIYQRRQSLAPLKNRDRLWQRLVARSLNLELAGPPRPGDFNKHEKRPEAHSAAPNRAQMQLIRSLSLYDAERQLIVGRDHRSGDSEWLPVYDGATTIAWLRYSKPEKLVRHSEQRFLEQQLRYLLSAGAAIGLLSFVLAALIARWLSGSIVSVRDAAERVGRGDFSARINNDSQDELGELCRSFNAMAVKLEHSEQLRRRWFADISHELRTPVAVLKAQIEAMLDGVRPSDTDNLNIVSRQIDDMSRLINDIFELALSDAKALVLHKHSCELALLLEEFHDDHLQHCLERGMEFSLQISDRDCLVNIDDKRFKQVLSNLLENSLRYSDKPGKIQWQLTKRGDVFQLSCDDSAPGVPASQQQQIFERLQRLEHSRNRASGGAGLGLALCRSLIEQHGGSIYAQSSPLGGLRIVIDLPNSGAQT
ncbi:ATP-binding protein [Agaribacterium haliotis]|uniref:ATP-binding protein n=1 Tax=Agaribacterium haliotis TaxID=2013869 RepID=UPI000BB57C55|nr:ATP-binding protein [Agaribacterium haliotis]